MNINLINIAFSVRYQTSKPGGVVLQFRFPPENPLDYSFVLMFILLHFSRNSCTALVCLNGVCIPIPEAAFFVVSVALLKQIG